ncbi:amino acid transporter [Chryseobacterium formosense]|uniref:Amino acid transporter n=1 Tax=Chryseobacterium formosense TaxID=236814 RepID=A0A085Z0N8_9FLAO|nr:amino acid permease [Chryseobacterium formosense]KFE98001.1 amino acid transporter [Chryseobacterium formosense]SFT71984.1 amino acid/polyamine/organocation transporter, APC superfamily [Chryseobacterium formosense]
MNQLFRRKPLSSTTLDENNGEIHSLKKVLSVKDLTFFGIAAIIGGGIFSAIGNACFSGGPGVIFLYAICAVACGFTAMCYAEFASRVPVSGSAYTYAYVSFGEIFAWIIGWALIMEYSIGNIYIAFSWSGYFTNLLDTFGLHLPEWLTINYKSAHSIFDNNTAFVQSINDYLANKASLVKDSALGNYLASNEVKESLKEGQNMTSILQKKATALQNAEGFLAWKNSPLLGSLKVIFDLPALMINVLITYLVYRGTKESKNLSNLMVYIKLAVIVLVIIVGFMYVDIDNWTPFMPNGFGGVMAGVSAVFYAYIGFDAVSTLAEEAKNPQKDLPRGMIYSLVICTVVYIILALVLTGMVSYTELGVSDPLAEIFALKGVKWMLFIVSISAVVAMTSVLLVFQMGQPRIWMTMSRDGLMPKKLSEIHPKYKTPGFATILTGIVVGLPIFFTDENLILDFTSIGTLFAFVLVCGGVLMLSPQSEEEMEERKGKFKIPYINSKFIFPIGFVLSLILVNYLFPTYFSDIFKDVIANIPVISFYLVCVVISFLAFIKRLSLIPILGLVSCCYLLTGMSTENWSWFGIWLVLGLIFYFIYGRKNSKLRNSKA